MYTHWSSRAIALALILGSLALCNPSAAVAQQPSVDALIPADTLLHRLNQQVQLTPDQRSEVAPIMIEHVEAMAGLVRSLEGKSRLAMLGMRRKFRRVVEATHKRIEPLLTDQQREAYDGFWDVIGNEQRQRMRGN
ncbi:MAG: hypothetical protein AAGJ10_08570 [Bacteroidota bacterium]